MRAARTRGPPHPPGGRVPSAGRPYAGVIFPSNSYATKTGKSAAELSLSLQSSMKKSPNIEAQRQVLAGLNQTTAAELLGCQTSHLRNHPARYQRNSDGTYPARELVRAALAEVALPVLDDSELEPLKQLCELAAAAFDGRCYIAIGQLAELHQRHGNRGLAAVGQMLLDELRTIHKIDPRGPEPPPPGVADPDRWEAWQNGRIVFGCVHCESYRWGRSWKPLPPPPGYKLQAYADICPRCNKDK